MAPSNYVPKFRLTILVFYLFVGKYLQLCAARHAEKFINYRKDAESRIDRPTDVLTVAKMTKASRIYNVIWLSYSELMPTDG